MSCSEAFSEVMSNDTYRLDRFYIYLASGKTANDLGLFDYCIENTNLTYSLVVVKSLKPDEVVRGEVEFGLCVPR